VQSRTIAPSLSSALNRATRGERLIWVGQADPRSSAKFALWFWLFAIPWNAFVLTGLPTSWHRPSAWLDTVFMLPFIVVGAGLFAAPLLIWLWLKRTVYGITHERFFAVTLLFGLRTRSFDVKDLQSVAVTERKDGSGDLTIKFRNRFDDENPLMAEVLSGLDDVKRIADLVDGLRLKASKAV
jgi:hypothetical protein